MKKWSLALLACISLAASAQMKEGRIVYERVQQLNFRVMDVDPEVAAQMPKSRTDHFELLFSNNQSLYQFLPTNTNEGGDQTFAGGGMVIRTAGVGANDVTFTDLTRGWRVERREMMEKAFTVGDSITRMNWKLSDETKTILNYTVRKATTTRVRPSRRMSMENGEMKVQVINDTVPVTVWYTTDIPVAVGPDFAGQLPGAVLQIDINNGQTVYTATEVSPKVSVAKIKEPKGKQLTTAEFEKEQEKLREEMRKNFSGGTFRIQQ